MKNYQLYAYTLWANKSGGDNDKKVSLEATENFTGEFVFYTRKDAQSKFEETVKVPFDIDLDAPKLGRKLFAKAAKTIQSNTYKMREMTQDTIICDYARLLSKDMIVMRVTCFVKIKDGKPSRYTKLTLHKMKDWDDFKNQQKSGKGGACGYTKDSIIFEMSLPIFGDVDNAFYPEDVEILENFASKLDVMFRNEGGYSDFRKRVFDFKYGNKEEVAYEDGGLDAKVETTGSDDDDEFPF